MSPKLVDYLLYEPDNSGILWIKFNRPDRLNALYGLSEVESTMAKVGEYMRAGDADPEIRVIVLTGVGKAFCAGADMKAEAIERLSDPGIDGTRQYFSEHFTPLFRDISMIRKPTIAMINGAAVGAGLDMALHCDIRLGCENTRFFTYQNVGQIPENGALYLLPRIVGMGRALELFYTGGFLEAEEAYRWGLLNHLYTSETLESKTRELCERIVASPPLVQWISKRIMRSAMDASLETTMQLTANASGILDKSEDSREARKAFLEKRKPQYKGR
jgi:enoyl-CoA hydratase/carnithine racemase